MFFGLFTSINFSKTAEQFSFRPTLNITFFNYQAITNNVNFVVRLYLLIYKLSLKMYLCSAKTGTKESQYTFRIILNE